MKYLLKPYMAFAQEGEGACLVFARNAREARNVSWKEVGSAWYDPESFLDWRVQLLDQKDWDYFYEEEADKEKLEKGISHTIECPKSCKCCGRWGKLIDGICEYCLAELKGDEKTDRDEEIEKLLDSIEELADKFKRYCHAPNCEDPNACPSKHPPCQKRLNLDTSLAWEAAAALFDIKWDILLGIPRSDLIGRIEGVMRLRNAVRRHSAEYPRLFLLFKEAEVILNRVVSITEPRRRC